MKNEPPNVDALFLHLMFHNLHITSYCVIYDQICRYNYMLLHKKIVFVIILQSYSPVFVLYLFGLIVVVV